jgi:hypothetical protein
LVLPWTKWMENKNLSTISSNYFPRYGNKMISSTMFPFGKGTKFA